MCSTAVTLGGGITMTNGTRSPPSRVVRSAWAVNTPAPFHRAYSAASSWAGSYWDARSARIDLERYSRGLASTSRRHEPDQCDATLLARSMPHVHPIFTKPRGQRGRALLFVLLARAVAIRRATPRRAMLAMLVARALDGVCLAHGQSIHHRFDTGDAPRHRGRVM